MGRHFCVYLHLHVLTEWNGMEWNGINRNQLISPFIMNFLCIIHSAILLYTYSDSFKMHAGFLCSHSVRRHHYVLHPLLFVRLSVPWTVCISFKNENF